jgi:chromosome segregation ATPase
MIAMNILYRVRQEGREAVVREIQSWKANGKDALLPWQMEELIRKALAERDEDEVFLRRVLERAGGEDPKRIDEANGFVQAFCDKSITVHNLLREMAADLGKLGQPVPSAMAQLDRATEDYQRWKEDYPDLLALAYTPLKKLLSKRIAKALERSPKESDGAPVFANKRQRKSKRPRVSTRR